MEQLVWKTGGWFALATLAFLAALAAADFGFAVHMGIVCAAALAVAVLTMRHAGYAAITRGLLKLPAPQGRYDDVPIRGAANARVLWGSAGLLAGVYLAV